MLKITNIRLTSRPAPDGFHQIAAEALGISRREVLSVTIDKLSVDARRKPDVRYVYTLLAETVKEKEILRKPPPNVTRYKEPERYTLPVLPAGRKKPHGQVVVTGAGPAGLFAALCLTHANVPCVLLERGKQVEERTADVHRFWNGGGLDESSNVQFGEGGAGTFSDGKLTCGLSDTRLRFIKETFVRFGAPEDILYLAKPHIGTDKLRLVVLNMRKHLLEHGCEVRFGHALSCICVADGKLKSITAETWGGDCTIETDKLILAVGNSARKTFQMLFESGIQLEPKNFSIGLRIEHRQCDIDLAQYGAFNLADTLPYPPSDYKLAVHLPSGRTVYTFCVCPGGQVVASSSEHGGVVTNGMSEYARNGENCNGALLVTVTPNDFDALPLGGIELQRRIERAAFEAGGGTYFAPVQLVSDFLHRKTSTRFGSVRPTYRPGTQFANFWDFLPCFICESIAEALPELEKRVKGFAAGDAVLTAAETRSSSPVRIVRNNFEAPNALGLFPCGEGAGYAGGIMSASLDGIKCAEQVLRTL